MNNSLSASNSSLPEINNSDKKSNQISKGFIFLSILLNICFAIAIVLLLSDRAQLEDKYKDQLVSITSTEVQKDKESMPTGQVNLLEGTVTKKTLTDPANKNNNLIEFNGEISNYKISSTNRMRLVGQTNDDISVSVDNDGDVQSLIVEFADGQQLNINAELEWEANISYEKGVKLVGSKIANLERVFVGTDKSPVWRYVDDSSKLDCENNVGNEEVVKQPCGSGYILLNKTNIVKAECIGADPSSCDAVMKTLEITQLSD